MMYIHNFKKMYCQLRRKKFEGSLRVVNLTKNSQGRSYTYNLQQQKRQFPFPITLS